MRVTTTTLRTMATQGDKITMLTCYDASFAALLDAAGVDTLLIGDSLGMVIQGRDSTLSVSLEAMLYHTECVARGAQRAMVIADMPFGSYQASPEQAFANAARLMAAGAQMVKLEGGALMAPTVRFLVARGIPVCGHLGLTPQSVHIFGGYKVQGREPSAAERLLADARSLADAGATLIVLEAMPATLGTAVTAAIETPTIGIGAGVECAGQVLVLHDMLDVYPGKKARFVKNFLVDGRSVRGAVEAYVREVKAGSFPAAEHCFN